MSTDDLTVVLLHGLGSSRLALGPLARRLRSSGYDTWTRTYPSRRCSLPDLASDLLAQIRRDRPKRRLVAVTHSMGGIVARHMPANTWDGIIMMAPPNRGSSLARMLDRSRLYGYHFGDAGRALAGEPAWPIPDAPTFIIAGTRHVSWHHPTSWVSQLADVFGGAPSDGTVAVEETHLPNMRDLTTVHANHRSILRSDAAHKTVLRYLGQLTS